MRPTIARLSTVVALLLLTAPFATGAQPAGKVYRIGMLETRSAVLNAVNIDAFRQRLRELGYTEGQNLEIVYRSSDGRGGGFPDLASELVRQNVDLILTRGTPAALAAKSATRTIPVVMAASAESVQDGPPVTGSTPMTNRQPIINRFPVIINLDALAPLTPAWFCATLAGRRPVRKSSTLAP